MPVVSIGLINFRKMKVIAEIKLKVTSQIKLFKQKRKADVKKTRPIETKSRVKQIRGDLYHENIFCRKTSHDIL